MKNEEIKQMFEKNFQNTDTQLVQIMKEAIKQTHAEPHPCQFSPEDIQGLKDLANMARQSKVAVKGAIIKVIIFALFIGLITIFGDKAKLFIKYLNTLF